MSSQIVVTCFTDLKDSTKLSEELGHQEYNPHLKHHLQVGKTLAESVGGNYVKNTGDGLMLTFTSPESAIQFSTQLQQYSAARPCFIRPALQVRVSLFLGTVEFTGEDVFGSGANQSARLQGVTEPGQVTINEELFQSLEKIWGREKTSKYLTSIGKCELKGISNPQQQELFSFDWHSYGKDEWGNGLVKRIYDHLMAASVEPWNLGPQDLAIPGVIIWPVVPRDIATAIHRGQGEIIRLLTMLGWKVKLLIADCGSKPYERQYCEQFCETLQRHLAARQITGIEIQYMSDLFEPSFDGYTEVQRLFRLVSEHVTLEDLLKINQKGYDSDVKEKIRQSPTLDFLRPALTVASVLYLAQDSAECANSKVIVVGGKDERPQWESALRVRITRQMLGAFMNPILKTDELHQGRQRRDWPIWMSLQSLETEMKEGRNLAWWVFSLHLLLPAFPSSDVMIGEQNLSQVEWHEDSENPSGLDFVSLAREAWKLLDPAL